MQLEGVYEWGMDMRTVGAGMSAVGAGMGEGGAGRRGACGGVRDAPGQGDGAEQMPKPAMRKGSITGRCQVAAVAFMSTAGFKCSCAEK